ncbi:MAG TPA: collagen-like protein, partial [Deltaproteobacteria bacterium]|nr:collagen-like protein [Deltaproteobacteria bacterium]
MRSHLQVLVVTALAVAVASPAWAVPAKFTQQGRLLDTGGQPLTGTHALAFSLYDADTGGVEQWFEYHSTDFDNGYYTVTLGDVTPLDDALFSGAPLWLEIAVDGVTLEPRQEIAAVPWALRAISAERVEGG